MRLRLFSSRKGVAAPNLVAIQDPALDMLPTVLVCPLRADEPLTPVHVEVKIGGVDYLVLCELARPIHHRVLVPVGELTEAESGRVMDTFQLLLAR